MNHITNPEASELARDLGVSMLPGMAPVFYTHKQVTDLCNAAIEHYIAQQAVEPEVAMIDAAMVEMANITPPLRRSECQRLIRAALTAQAAPRVQVPLTYEQIDEIWRTHLHRDSRVRAIEAAHGIGGKV